MTKNLKKVEMINKKVFKMNKNNIYYFSIILWNDNIFYNDNISNYI